VTATRVVLIGTGGLGRETAWAFEGAGANPTLDLLGFVTSERGDQGRTISGHPVLGDESWLIGQDGIAAVCCIGDPRVRMRLVAELTSEGVKFASAIHPTALISPAVALGPGVVVGARAVITTQVTIGGHVVIGAGAIVSHDCVIDDFATLAPGVMLAGNVRIERGAELGIGASVRPRQEIGAGALVGAGSVVVGDVSANSVWAGVPAARIREMEPIEPD
jgi:sugar O-acyltransferase (sialic acid O-acetyltransferase NeuD family)